MNQKRIKPVFQVLNGGKKMDTSLYFQKVINDHFPLIEKMCFSITRRHLQGNSRNNPVTLENEALELSNQVLDTLRRDDYRVLRQFKGNAKLSTYLTTIVARQAVDVIRKKLGRSREKERAQKFGKAGLLIYENIFLQGAAVPEFYPTLKEQGISLSLEEVEAIAQKIKGKKGGLADLPGSNPVVKNGATINEDGETIIPDTAHDPQELLMNQQKEQKLGQVVKDIIAHLDGEERMILRMRFPVEEEEKPGKVENIAKILGISEKAVYKRIARIMKKCRELVSRQGVTIHDLL